MSEHKYIIRGIPTAQGRPRFYRRGAFVGAYDPKKSKQAKDNIAAQLAAQKPHYSELPLGIEIWFFLPRPKSFSEKKIQFHVKKPVVKEIAVKAYCNKLHPYPMTQITVTEFLPVGWRGCSVAAKINPLEGVICLRAKAIRRAQSTTLSTKAPT